MQEFLLPPTPPYEQQSNTLPCDVNGALFNSMCVPSLYRLPFQAAHENQHEIASKFWSRSLRKSEKHDKELVDTWKGDADGILIFVRDHHLFLTRTPTQRLHLRT
jgi:hypothetical protein